jgi:hypothetical protein
MIRSKLADPWLDVDLDGGWHAMEDSSWRWTERIFSVLLKPTASAKTLRFRFTIPEALGPVRIHATANGTSLPVREYPSLGEHTYIQPIPPLTTSIRFEFNKALEPSPADLRELGVQVKFWSYETPTPRALTPISVS